MGGKRWTTWTIKMDAGDQRWQLTSEIVNAEADTEEVDDVAPQARVLPPAWVRVVIDVRKGCLLRGHVDCCLGALSGERSVIRSLAMSASSGREIPCPPYPARISRHSESLISST